MSVILLGSPFNPLSGVAADFFHGRGELKLVLLPRHVDTARDGLPQLAALSVVAGYRLARTMLAAAGIKRNRPWGSLMEFLAAYPRIPREKIPLGRWCGDELLARHGFQPDRDETWVVCCIFPHKLPDYWGRQSRVVNIHPGILPENRGPDPYFWTLANRRPESGLTFHVLVSRLDEGPILHLARFAVPSRASQHGLERMSAEVLGDTLPEFWENRQRLWENAAPQGEGVYYPHPDTTLRARFGLKTRFSRTR